MTRIDAIFFEINDVGQENMIEEFCNIYYKLVRRRGWSLPSEGASATAKSLEFMAQAFQKKNGGIKAFPSPEVAEYVRRRDGAP